MTESTARLWAVLVAARDYRDARKALINGTGSDNWPVLFKRMHATLDALLAAVAEADECRWDEC